VHHIPGYPFIVHQITVTALSPLVNLSPVEADAEWEKGIHDLRRDGARPREVSSCPLVPQMITNCGSAR
jgi:hypothetical protein